MNHQPRIALAATSCALVVGLAACGSPGSDAPPSRDDEAVNTDVDTLRGVVDITIDATQAESLKPLTDAFTAEHPDVTFDITGEDFAALQQNAPRLMAGDEVPDLIALPTPGNTVEDGLVRNLDAYAEAYGWDEFPSSQLDQWRIDDDGVRGQGSLYGMGIGFTLVGVYYNKTLAAQAGITEPPATLADLEAALEAAKAADVTPLLTSGKDGLVFFPYQLLWLGQGAAADARAWVLGAPGATIDAPPAVAAAETLQSWAADGYLSAEVLSTDAATAQSQFADGKGMFFVTGNWLAAPLGDQMGDEVGFFLFPPAEGSPYAAMSDPANFVIPARADDADAAAAFLDFTTSDAGRQLVVQNQGLAPGGPADAAPVTSDVAVVGEAAEAFQALSREDGIVPFMGNATASFFASTLMPQLQLLLADKVTPDAFATALQSDYAAQLGQ
jgi:multiple sugar transport system substrate-binding protein/raffinose/stachyose/melibiose transport system substrate-binding protein